MNEEIVDLGGAAKRDTKYILARSFLDCTSTPYKKKSRLCIVELIFIEVVCLSWLLRVKSIVWIRKTEADINHLISAHLNVNNRTVIYSLQDC